MNVSVGAKSDVGRAREINEDSFLVHEPLFVVADGMGGHSAGDVASQTVIKTIKERADEATAADLNSLAELVRGANHVVWEKAQADPSLRGMGTTCTLLLLDADQAHIAHVGDSRAYLFHDGELKQITHDHSLVARMVEEGRISPEEAEHHPQRNIVTRALGVDSDVEVDLLTIDLHDGDRVLICSDGLSSMTDTPFIQQVLEATGDAQAAADRLIDLANSSGGEDNITVVVIDVGGGSGRADTRPDYVRADTQERQRPTEEQRATYQSTQPSATPPPQMTAMRPIPQLDPQSTSAIRAPTYEEEETDEAPRRRWPKRLVILVLVVALLAGAAYGATRYVLANSFFVGVNDSGKVTIFKGIPEEIAGLTLSQEQEVTDLSAADLPQSLEENVTEGIKRESLDEAQTTVENLQTQADELRNRSTPRGDRNDNQTKG